MLLRIRIVEPQDQEMSLKLFSVYIYIPVTVTGMIPIQDISTLSHIHSLTLSRHACAAMGLQMTLCKLCKKGEYRGQHFVSSLSRLLPTSPARGLPRARHSCGEIWATSFRCCRSLAQCLSSHPSNSSESHFTWAAGPGGQVRSRHQATPWRRRFSKRLTPTLLSGTSETDPPFIVQLVLRVKNTPRTWTHLRSFIW